MHKRCVYCSLNCRFKADFGVWQSKENNYWHFTITGGLWNETKCFLCFAGDCLLFCALLTSCSIRGGTLLNICGKLWDAFLYRVFRIYGFIIGYFVGGVFGHIIHWGDGGLLRDTSHTSASVSLPPSPATVLPSLTSSSYVTASVGPRITLSCCTFSPLLAEPF